MTIFARSRVLGLALTLAALSLGIPSPVSAAAPANDDFANAQVVSGTLPILVSGSNLDATPEPGEPDHDGVPADVSVWFSWTPVADQRVEIAACDGEIDTRLGVYTGAAVDALTTAGVRVDLPPACLGFNTMARLDAVAGTTYHIAVDGFLGQEGAFQLRIRPIVPPANDAFANAQAVTGSPPIVVHGTNTDATAEAGEPDHDDDPAIASVWFAWTPAVEQRVVIDACEGQLLSRLGVYTGSSVGALTAVGVEIDPQPSCGFDPVTRLDAVPGVTYYIAVDGYSDEDSFQLRIRPVSPPPNDDFANAQVLVGDLPISVAVTNVDATKEIGEPSLPQNDGGSSVWYAWTAGVTGSVLLDPCDADFFSLIGVFTGDALPSLTLVTSRRNFGGCDPLAVPVTAGTTYRIVIDGVLLTSGIDQGETTLQIRQPNAPPNDDFADATVLSGDLPITVSGTNMDASEEIGEPDHAGAPGATSIWFRWTPETSGMASVDTCQSDFDTLLAVYTGSEVGALSEVASNDDHAFCPIRSFVRFEAIAGTTYQIAVDGFPQTIGGATGNVVLEIAGPPPNDNFADAAVVSGSLPIAATGTTFNATKEPGEPDHAGNPGGNSIWFSWTPASSEDVVIDTCGSGVMHVLAVYTGSSLGSLVEVASSDDGCDGEPVIIQATTGTTYQIAVDGFGSSGGVNFGSVVLNIAPPIEPPANDAFADSLALSGTLPLTASGTNVGATKEPGEADHAGNRGGASIWYRWNPAISGPVAIATCESDFDTLLAVYTGTDPGNLTEIASSDDACGLRSSVAFTAVAGLTYHIAVDGYTVFSRPATGQVELVIESACTTTITGTVASVVASSGTTCLDGAKVSGSVSVDAGASLWSNGARIKGSVEAIDAIDVAMCGSHVGGDVTLTGSDSVALGGPGCDPNQVSGSVSVSDTTGPSVIAGNKVKGDLECQGNDPAPVNGGLENDVHGSATGQCSGL